MANPKAPSWRHQFALAICTKFLPKDINQTPRHYAIQCFKRAQITEQLRSILKFIKPRDNVPLTPRFADRRRRSSNVGKYGTWRPTTIDLVMILVVVAENPSIPRAKKGRRRLYASIGHARWEKFQGAPPHFVRAKEIKCDNA